MTAPARSRSRVQTAAKRARATTTEQAPQPTRTARKQQGRGRTTAAERAYARRAQRAEHVRVDSELAPGAARTSTPRLRLSWPTSRASFVLIMMGLLAAGVATTLWLTTQSIADSYRLEDVRKDTAGLAERAEGLQRDVTREESAFALAQKAKALGMVPGGDPAHIVVGPDGGVRVVGEPRQATAPAAPEQPAPPEQPPTDLPPAPAPVDQAPPPPVEDPAAENPAPENPAEEAAAGPPIEAGAQPEAGAPPPEGEG